MHSFLMIIYHFNSKTQQYMQKEPNYRNINEILFIFAKNILSSSKINA